MTTKRLLNELAKYKENPPQYCKLKPDGDNLLVWYFVIYGLSDMYQGGVYMGKIECPKDYPARPPVFRMLTPNGRFKEGETLCTTFTNYHTEAWTPIWNIEKMVMGLISLMFESAEAGSAGAGIAGIVSSPETCLKFAQKSMEWNLNNEKFIELFSEDFLNQQFLE